MDRLQGPVNFVEAVLADCYYSILKWTSKSVFIINDLGRDPGAHRNSPKC